MQRKKSQIEITQVIARLKRVFDAKTDSELADKLGVKQNTISTWKIRGTLDYPLIIANCDKIDLNWLFGTHHILFAENNDAPTREIADRFSAPNNVEQYDPAIHHCVDFAAAEDSNKGLADEKKSKKNYTENVRAKCEGKNVRAKENLLGQNASPNNGLPSDSIEKGGEDPDERIDTLNRFIQGLQTRLKHLEELLEAKEQLIQAKDVTITTQNTALKLIEHQMDASSRAMEAFISRLKNE
ncbi:MAG: helix-turn-helix domain-containing protein [Alistipes sp.]|nr:helix-turn-helix domain-containing protein [Alistipes sp.]